MSWPQSTDYNAAVQSPDACFSDPELQQGTVAADLFGLPRPYTGNFAAVYQVSTPAGRDWAIKCFTREVPDLRARYQAVSDRLEGQHRPFMVEFRYLEEGIRVAGTWYPIIKMRWVEGPTLNVFVQEQLRNAPVLDRLARLFVKLGLELREARVAHGDLQHGNVLLVPGRKDNSLALKLVDYDGMFVEALAGNPPPESGHPNYQHPQRLKEGGYDADADRFSLLVAYTALRALLAAPELWNRYDNGDNLLFKSSDFSDPSQSKLLQELWGLPDPEVQALAGRLVLASQGALGQVPFLPDLVAGGQAPPLTPAEVGRVTALLGVAPAGVPEWLAPSHLTAKPLAPPPPGGSRCLSRLA